MILSPDDLTGELSALATAFPRSVPSTPPMWIAIAYLCCIAIILECVVEAEEEDDQ